MRPESECSVNSSGGRCITFPEASPDGTSWWLPCIERPLLNISKGVMKGGCLSLVMKLKGKLGPKIIWALRILGTLDSVSMDLFYLALVLSLGRISSSVAKLRFEG